MQQFHLQDQELLNENLVTSTIQLILQSSHSENQKKYAKLFLECYDRLKKTERE